VGAYTPGELAAYEKFWDIVSTEKSMVSSSLKKGHAEGRAEGEAIGIEKGRAEALREMARKAMRDGLPLAQVQALTGLSEKEIKLIING
jgi:predicted transposase/invertase (TIGR01784 family)